MRKKSQYLLPKTAAVILFSKNFIQGYLGT